MLYLIKLNEIRLDELGVAKSACCRTQAVRADIDFSHCSVQSIGLGVNLPWSTVFLFCFSRGVYALPWGEQCY